MGRRERRRGAGWCANETGCSSRQKNPPTHRPFFSLILSLHPIPVSSSSFFFIRLMSFFCSLCITHHHHNDNNTHNEAHSQCVCLLGGGSSLKLSDNPFESAPCSFTAYHYSEYFPLYCCCCAAFMMSVSLQCVVLMQLLQKYKMNSESGSDIVLI